MTCRFKSCYPQFYFSLACPAYLLYTVAVSVLSNRNFRIDGKSLLGLMSIKLGLPMRLIVSGEDEDLAHQYFTNFEME